MTKPTFVDAKRLVRCCINQHPIGDGHQANFNGTLPACRVCGRTRREWFWKPTPLLVRLNYRYQMYRWRKYNARSHPV
jgi:hypothetical protein